MHGLKSEQIVNLKHPEYVNGGNNFQKFQMFEVQD